MSIVAGGKKPSDRWVLGSVIEHIYIYIDIKDMLYFFGTYSKESVSTCFFGSQKHLFVPQKRLQGGKPFIKFIQYRVTPI